MKTTHLLTMVPVLITLVGCSKDSSKSASSTSTATTEATSTSKSSAQPEKKSEKTASTKLTDKQVDEAYEAAIKGKMMDSFDTKKATLVKMLGEAQQTVSSKFYWYGLRAATGTQSADCKELMIGSDGAASLGGTDEEYCFGKTHAPDAQAASSANPSTTPSGDASASPSAGGPAQLEGDYTWYSDSGSGSGKLTPKDDGFIINYGGTYTGAVNCKPSKIEDLYNCSYSENDGSGSANLKKTKDLDLVGSWSDGSSSGGWTFKRVRK
jgi:hypothetical protein